MAHENKYKKAGIEVKLELTYRGDELVKLELYDAKGEYVQDEKEFFHTKLVEIFKTDTVELVMEFCDWYVNCPELYYYEDWREDD